jgi:hypothetical protein
MRNLFVLIGLIIALSLSAQTKLTKGGAFKGLDKQGDTLVASDTLDYTLEIGNDVYGIMNLAVESDSVSGVAAYDSYLYKSLNGVDWGSPIDTISLTGGGDSYLEYITVNATSTYYLIRTISTGATQKSNFKIWGRLNEGFVLQE